MAELIRTSGDFLPVMNFDSSSYTSNGIHAVQSASTVQPQGPKLDFFTISLTSVTANTVAPKVVSAVQQLSTVHIYEFTAPDTLAIAVYPAGAWTTASLKAALDEATGGASTVTPTATFTN